MRFLHRLTLLTALVASLGFAPPPDKGPPSEYVVTDYGARPGVQDGSVNEALEAIHGEIAARRQAGDQGRVVVVFPASARPYVFHRPWLMDLNKVIIRGDETRPVLGSSDYFFGPHIVLGVKRTHGTTGKPTSPEHWLDLNELVRAGELDRSVAPTPNRRWGLRTGDGTTGGRGDKQVVLPVSPLSQPGRHWRDVRQLTASVALCAPDGGVLPGSTATLGGWRIGFMDGTQTHPWAIVSGPDDTIHIVFSTTDGEPGLAGLPIHRHVFAFRHGGATGVVDLTVKIDLVNRVVAAWVNREPVEVTQVSADLEVSGWNDSTTLQFTANVHHPFVLGGDCSKPLSANAKVRDVVFCGLHVRAGVSFDPTTADDWTTYFRDNDPSTLGYLPLTDGPDGIANGRLVRVHGGPGRGIEGRPDDPVGMSGYSDGFFYDTTGTGHGQSVPQVDVRIADLEFQLSGHQASEVRKQKPGCAVAAGAIVELDIERCQFVSGQHGLASLVSGGNHWEWTLRDVETIYQWDSGLYLAFNSGNIDGYRAHTVGISGIRMRGVGWTVRDSFFGSSYPFCETVVDVAPSGGLSTGLTLDNIEFDQEHTGASVAAVRIAGQWPYARVSVNNCKFASVKPGSQAAWIALTRGDSSAINQIRITDPFMWGRAPGGDVVDVVGNWTGSVDVPGLWHGPPIIRCLTPGATTGIVHRP